MCYLRRLQTLQTELDLVLSEAERHLRRVNPEWKSVTLTRLDGRSLHHFLGLMVGGAKATRQRLAQLRIVAGEPVSPRVLQTLKGAEEQVRQDRQSITCWFKPLPGADLSKDDGIVRACFTDHPWYGTGPFSWHKNEADAMYNAAITNGAVATVVRDQDGDYCVPLEERVTLGRASLAW
jgi:hypothetical protein